ncbi:MAG: hypothetical protein IT416_01750 [Candidatus Pacebacteria bacterium]|nr:hypothetical protein [Candidatus Paceibacterota bacterium]
MKEKKSLSRTLLEKRTEDQLINEYGREGLLTILLKSLLRHDSDRHLRRREKSEKAEKKKAKLKND